MSRLIPYAEHHRGIQRQCARAVGTGLSGNNHPTCAPAPESALAELTRTVWSRWSLHQELVKRSVRVAHNTKTGEFALQLNRDIDVDLMPWFRAAQGSHGYSMPYSFFVRNAKMQCQGWDLPAGPPTLGGSCPAATAGQIVVPDDLRFRAQRDLADRGVRVRENDSICAACYASGFPFSAPMTQAGEIVRLWWTKLMMETPETRAEWAETMAQAILSGNANKRPEKTGGYYVRIHSSGDFFSPSYFAMWVDVVRRVEYYTEQWRMAPTYFWAPTRVWMMPGYDWGLVRSVSTLVVRPSSYHVEDPAPGPMISGGSKGSTSVYFNTNLGPGVAALEVIGRHAAGRAVLTQYAENQQARGVSGPDPRYDWPCMTYAIQKSGQDASTSCKNAISPEGTVGCRACWRRPDLSIDYTVH